MKRFDDLKAIELIADFFVEGDPQAMPKAILNEGKYRPKESTRQRKWKEFAVIMARQETKRMIEKDEAFGMHMVFAMKRPKTVTRKYPIVIPDDDNLGYLITNALKGICYYDDCHRIKHTIEKIYANPHDQDDPPGLYISIWVIE